MANVKKVILKSQIVLGLREIGSYSIMPKLFSKLFPYAMSRGMKIEGPLIFICHETAQQAIKADKEGSADVEVCVPVKEQVEIDEQGGELGIACYQLPGGTFAKIIHKGPYEQCEPAYQELFKWISEKGYRITGSVREYYLNDPKEVKPEEIETEICAPIQEGGENKDLTKEVK